MSIQRLERFARSHCNVVYTKELHALGYTDMEIHRMVRRGYLHRIARGVYAVGSRYLSFHGRCRVALGLAGADAFITGLAALYILGLITYEPRSITVASPRKVRRTMPGVRFRITRTRMPCDIRIDQGVPVATAARAIVDLAPTHPADKLAKFLREARFHRQLDLDAVIEAAARCAHAGGAAAMREAIAMIQRGSQGSWSNFESDGWSRLYDAIPGSSAVQNVDLELEGIPTIPDMLWTEFKIVVEFDGAPHEFTDVLDDDAKRDRRYRRNGYAVIRVTPHDLRARTGEIRADLVLLAERQHQLQATAVGSSRQV